MIDAIINGWWKVLALMAGAGLFLWVALLAVVHFLSSARKSGVDEVEVGNVKIDFEGDDEKK